MQFSSVSRELGSKFKLEFGLLQHFRVQLPSFACTDTPEARVLHQLRPVLTQFRAGVCGRGRLCVRFVAGACMCHVVGCGGWVVVRSFVRLQFTMVQEREQRMSVAAATDVDAGSLGSSPLIAPGSCMQSAWWQGMCPSFLQMLVNTCWEREAPHGGPVAAQPAGAGGRRKVQAANLSV